MQDLPVNKMPAKSLLITAISQFCGCISITCDFQDAFFDVFPFCEEGKDVAVVLRREGVLPDRFGYSSRLYGSAKAVEGLYGLRLEFIDLSDAEWFVESFNLWLKEKRERAQVRRSEESLPASVVDGAEVSVLEE